MTVAVVDYGLGNVGSIVNMFRKIGEEAIVTWSPASLVAASAILIPGVGSFDAGAVALRTAGLDCVLRERAQAGVPLLGICLGMQLLGRRSDEGHELGLGLLDADTVAVEPAPGLRVPHIGWTPIENTRSPIFAQVAAGAEFYFMHSYEMACDDDATVVATCDHGGTRVAAVQRDNVFGVQFHPEKSHRNGMDLFRGFLRVR